MSIDNEMQNLHSIYMQTRNEKAELLEDMPFDIEDVSSKPSVKILNARGIHKECMFYIPEVIEDDGSVSKDQCLIGRLIQKHKPSMHNEYSTTTQKYCYPNHDCYYRDAIIYKQMAKKYLADYFEQYNTCQSLLNNKKEKDNE